MKALILVGGYGTRMRPLTLSCPKSVLPFVNKPMVQHQIQALAQAGVKEVILAINYQSDIIKEDLAKLSARYGIKVTFVKEEQALGTAGPLKLSEKILKEDNQSGMIFVFNSDIICDFPLKELLTSHKSHGKQATIVLAAVQDPSRFGVVVTNEEQKVERFVEKPKQFVSNKINAGLYILNTSVIDMIPERFCMIEKEVFPQLAEKGQLYALPLKNDFWFDLGKPQDYLLGQGKYLQYYKVKPENIQTVGNCLIDPSAEIGENCQIGPNVVIGPGVKIGVGCRLKNCTIYQKTKIGNGCYIADSIVSWECSIGNWARIQGLSALAENVQIKPDVRVTKCMILSHKGVSQSLEGQILM